MFGGQKKKKKIMDWEPTTDDDGPRTDRMIGLRRTEFRCSAGGEGRERTNHGGKTPVRLIHVG